MTEKYKPKFYGKMKGGKFVLHDPEGYRKHTELFEEEQEMQMTLEKRTKKRTQGDFGEGTNQNGYLWGVLIRGVADEIGEMDQDYVYHWVLITVGHFKVMPGGTKVPDKTSDMEAGPFQELCKRIQIWAATPGNVCEKGMYLPDPHETNYDI